MFHSISLQNFKMYRENTTFSNLKNINILTGVNGRGKSTLLHALLLPKQSLAESKTAQHITLNGEYVELGNAKDVKNECANRSEQIQICYGVYDHTLQFKMSVPNDASQKLQIDSLSIDSVMYSPEDGAWNNLMPEKAENISEELTKLFNSILYISAERIGPKLNYSPAVDNDIVDPKGKGCACVFYNHQHDSINSTMIETLPDFFPGMSNEDFLDSSFNGVLEFWLGKMFDETKIHAEYVSSANIYVLNYTTSGNTRESKPTNVGFGYSYVLPILVAGLLAKCDDVLIVENPEAHLHPQAQSVLGKFLAWISLHNGIQVFVETHSEHIVNSFRVLIAQGNMSPQELNMLFFDKDFDKYARVIPVDEKGKIDSWPPRFFDQEEKDLDIIL